jgi:hypothetical protein
MTALERRKNFTFVLFTMSVPASTSANACHVKNKWCGKIRLLFIKCMSYSNVEVSIKHDKLSNPKDNNLLNVMNSITQFHLYVDITTFLTRHLLLESPALPL